MTAATAIVQKQLTSFGLRLKDLRLRRGWTLEDLARQSGYSKAFLSRLESGSRQASISAILTLSNLFEASLASMFEEQLVLEPCAIVRGAEVTLQTGEGLTYAPLSHASHLFNLKPIRLSFSLQREGNEHYQHEGEEWIYVLSGQLTLSLDGKTYDLELGDSAHFDSRLPHRLIARGTTDTELLLVSSPCSTERQKVNYFTTTTQKPTRPTLSASLPQNLSTRPSNHHPKKGVA